MTSMSSSHVEHQALAEAQEPPYTLSAAEINAMQTEIFKDCMNLYPEACEQDNNYRIITVPYANFEFERENAETQTFKGLRFKIVDTILNEVIWASEREPKEETSNDELMKWKSHHVRKAAVFMAKEKERVRRERSGGRENNENDG